MEELFDVSELKMRWIGRNMSNNTALLRYLREYRTRSVYPRPTPFFTNKTPYQT